MVVSVAGVFHHRCGKCLTVITGKYFAARRTGIAVDHHRLQTVEVKLNTE